MAPHLLFILLLLVLILPASAIPAEIDAITPQKRPLPDSLHRLNTIVNERLRQGIDNANSHKPFFGGEEKSNYCDEAILYRELRKALFGSRTTSLGLKGYGLDQQLQELLAGNSISLALEDSIYRDITYVEGFSLNLKELSDVVKVDGHLIGLDKLGHFFAEGWSYFEMTSFEQKTLEEAIQWGREREEGSFGYTTTGIFSYADLVANFNGWRFWNSIRGAADDPLKGRIANFFAVPYVGCGIRILDSLRSRTLVYGWTVKKNFDLLDYLDGSWDSRNNCVSFKNEQIEEKVTHRIKQVAPNFRCPSSKNICTDAITLYGKHSKELLHPDCLRAGVSAK